MIHIRTALHEYRSTSQPFPLLRLCARFPFPCVMNHPFYLLGNPSFGDRGANVHPHSSLVGDRLPTPCSLPFPSPPNRSHSSCYMFSKTTSQHQLHCLIQYIVHCTYMSCIFVCDRKSVVTTFVNKIVMLQNLCKNSYTNILENFVTGMVSWECLCNCNKL